MGADLLASTNWLYKRKWILAPSLKNVVVKSRKIHVIILYFFLFLMLGWSHFFVYKVIINAIFDCIQFKSVLWRGKLILQTFSTDNSKLKKKIFLLSSLEEFWACLDNKVVSVSYSFQSVWMDLEREHDLYTK